MGEFIMSNNALRVNNSNEIFFNFTNRALDLLGKQLYTNKWTAISELVANGMDASANEILIYINMIDKERSIIEIIDNGAGMNYTDLAEKYTFIGRNRREDKLLSDADRSKQLGRKGVGKLAALFLSKKYFLASKTHNESSAWCLDSTGKLADARPKLERVNMSSLEIECLNEWGKITTGTIVKLTDVNFKNVGENSLEGLRARMADFYLLDEIGATIKIACVQYPGEKINFKVVQKRIAFKNFYSFFSNPPMLYRDKLSQNVEYSNTKFDEVNSRRRDVIILDNQKIGISIKGETKFLTSDEDDGAFKILPYELKGWIGIHTTIDKKGANKNDDNFIKNNVYSPNKLRLYVRKKLAVDDFLPSLKNNQAMSNYIEGEISFDILDHNDLPDIATASRQGFSDSDERIALLKKLLKPIVNALIKERVNLGNIVKAEADDIIKQQKEEAEAARKAADDKAEEATKQAAAANAKVEQTEQALKIAKAETKNEASRNKFLYSTISKETIDFTQNLHTIGIVLGTMESQLKVAIRSNENNVDTELLNNMAYGIKKIKAIITYGKQARFDVTTEQITEDVFAYIDEYVNEIAQYKQYERPIKIFFNNPQKLQLEKRFSVQDVTIILENIISNSSKNNSKNLSISIMKTNNEIKLIFCDDGDGIDRQQIKDVNVLFEFGKTYTSPKGTGVGLYQIKKIFEKIDAEVRINNEYKNGFKLEVTFDAK